MIAVSIFSLLKWGLVRGLDFTGGTIIEYSSEATIDTSDATAQLNEGGFDAASIQGGEGNTYIVRLRTVPDEKKDALSALVSEKIFDGSVEETRFESVGPSIGPELVKKTAYAVILASVLILVWIAYQFKSFVFGASAILAMFHDTFILVGMFALMGHFLHAEVDFLFVTALLTTLSFSVHDTIVVFDRIRELTHKNSNLLHVDNANKALSETMVRSLNNSFTIVFMLLALLLMGGVTIKWFAAALLIGTVLGTYSSPFIAVPLLLALHSYFGKK